MPTWTRWTLYDPNLDTAFTFAHNPDEGGYPDQKKTVSAESTLAGAPIFHEGAQPAKEIDWKGVLLTKTERDNFKTWFDKPYQVRLTDDLDEARWIYIDRFTPTRKRVINREVKYEYTIHAFVLDVT